MKKLMAVLSAASVAGQISCAPSEVHSGIPAGPSDISLCRVLQAPDAYDKMRIRVRGRIETDCLENTVFIDDSCPSAKKAVSFGTGARGLSGFQANKFWHSYFKYCAGDRQHSVLLMTITGVLTKSATGSLTLNPARYDAIEIKPGKP